MMMTLSKKMKTVLSSHYGLNEIFVNGQKNHVTLLHMNIGSLNKKKIGLDALLYFNICDSLFIYFNFIQVK